MKMIVTKNIKNYIMAKIYRKNKKNLGVFFCL